MPRVLSMNQLGECTCTVQYHRASISLSFPSPPPTVWPIVPRDTYTTCTGTRIGVTLLRRPSPHPLVNKLSIQASPVCEPVSCTSLPRALDYLGDNGTGLYRLARGIRPPPCPSENHPHPLSHPTPNPVATDNQSLSARG